MYAMVTDSNIMLRVFSKVIELLKESKGVRAGGALLLVDGPSLSEISKKSLHLNLILYWYKLSRVLTFAGIHFRDRLGPKLTFMGINFHGYK